MKILKVGVIGTGNMGRNHVRNYLQEVGRFELVGVYDIDYELAIKVAKQYGTTAYKDIDDLLDAVEAVSIVVPSSLHREVATRVVNKNVHALIEKPLALNSEDAKEITEMFENRNLILQVGHIERFNPVVVEMEKILKKDEVFFVEIHRYSPFSGSGRITDTSVVEDLMIHDIDLASLIMEPLEVLDVKANGESISSSMIDFATAMLSFGNNVHAIINSSRVSQTKERLIEIHSKNDYIVADLLTKTLTITKNTNMVVDGMDNSTYKQDGVMQKIFVPLIEPLHQELLSFYESVVNDAPVKVTGLMGTKAIEICEKVICSINDMNKRG